MFTIVITFWMKDPVRWITDGPGIASTLALYDMRQVQQVTITASRETD